MTDLARASDGCDKTGSAPVRVDADMVIGLVMEAIDLPAPLTVADGQAHADLLEHRVRHLVQTLPHLTTTAAAAHSTPDAAAGWVGWHVDYLRARLAELPVTYGHDHVQTAGTEAAR